MSESFSLLMAYYAGDSGAFLNRALHSSVTDQTLRPDEVVLVQDGPVPDELKQVVDEFAAFTTATVRLVNLEKNGGLALALAAGLNECSFDIVARMDADDISEPCRFEQQIPMLLAGLDVVGASMLEFTEDRPGHIVPVRIRRAPIGPEHIARYSRFHVPVHHPTVIFRKSAVERVGGYEPLGAMEDYWLWARLITGGARFDNHPSVQVRYRISSGAYARRGGLAQLKTEIALQGAFRRLGFTTSAQRVRNLLLRGGYRLLPEWIRRIAYRRLILGRGTGDFANTKI